MRWIYLSPHLDDAAFTAGGLIYEQTRAGIPVEIWTCMCGYPPQPEGELSPMAQLLHRQWGFASAEETVRSRREEDDRAAAILGAKTLHLDFLDCIYRRGADGNWLYTDVFGVPHPQDAGIPAQVAETISARLRADDVLVCQLAVGEHVDHILVRRGAERLGRPLLYAVDVPYILSHPGEWQAKSAGMQASVHPVTETGLGRWKEAALAYKSQLAALGQEFDTPEKVRAAIQGFWAELGGIRLFGTNQTV